MNVNIEKAQELAGKPLRLAQVSITNGEPNFREEFQTGYEYWMRYKADIMAKKTAHRVGYWENNEFNSKPKFTSGGWEKTTWSDYEYEENGKTFNYFKKKMIGRIEFESPQDLRVWNPEEKTNGIQGVKEAYVTISPNLYEKIAVAYADPRTSMDDYVEIIYTAKNPPATKYEVRFAKVGEPREAVEETTQGPTVNLFPHEAEILKDVNGDEADEATLVEYLVGEAESRGITDMSDERAHEIATGVIIDGKVVLP